MFSRRRPRVRLLLPLLGAVSSISGDIAFAELDDSSNAQGSPVITAASAQIEESDSSTGLGSPVIVCSFPTTGDDHDSSLGAGTTVVVATIAFSEEADTSTGTISQPLPSVTGTMQFSEGDDICFMIDVRCDPAEIAEYIWPWVVAGLIDQYAAAATAANVGANAMTFDELYEEVIKVTKRPELEAETILAIKRATLLLHSSDNYARDLIIGSYTLPVAGYAASIELNQFPRLRTFSWVREKTLTGNTGEEIMLDPLDSDMIFDEYLVEKTNYFYVAGAVLNVKCSNVLSAIDYAYFALPSTVYETYNSWIAEQYPYAIVDEAASSIFKLIGKDDEASRYKEASRENIQYLRQNYVGSKGR